MLNDLLIHPGTKQQIELLLNRPGGALMLVGRPGSSDRGAGDDDGDGPGCASPEGPSLCLSHCFPP